MIRLLVLLLALFVVAAGTAWLADRPGRLVVDWGGYRIETLAAVAALGVVLLMLATAALHRLWRWLRAGPGALGGARAGQRQRRGYQALTQGMVAVAAGDARRARQLAGRAEGLLEKEPLALVLSAQAAQLAGDEGAARRHFTAMLERPETEFLGLRGLLVQATREGDRETALGLVRRARELRPEAPWVLETLFELDAAGGHWAEAEAALGQAVKRKLIEPGVARRRKGVVLLGRALEAEAAGAATAFDLALEARDAAPELVPATVLAARLLAAAGKGRRAAKLIEEGWKRAPHPDLAAAFWALEPDETPAQRKTRAARLVAARPEHAESRIALAGLALATGSWDEARAQLEPLGEAADVRALPMMAELAEREGDTAAARAWLLRAAARPAPTWLCRECGEASAAWTPHCAACGAFDGLAWEARLEAGAALAPPEAGAEAAEPPLPAPAAETEAETLPAPAAPPEVPPPPDVPVPEASRR